MSIISLFSIIGPWAIGFSYELLTIDGLTFDPQPVFYNIENSDIDNESFVKEYSILKGNRIISLLIDEDYYSLIDENFQAKVWKLYEPKCFIFKKLVFDPSKQPKGEFMHYYLINNRISKENSDTCILLRSYYPPKEQIYNFLRRDYNNNQYYLIYKADTSTVVKKL